MNREVEIQTKGNLAERLKIYAGNLENTLSDKHYVADMSAKIMREAAETIEGMSLNWIPVEERLPEKNGSYLIQVDSSDGSAMITFMMVDHFNEDGTWLHCDNKRRKVVAWMPLPEPYREGEE